MLCRVCLIFLWCMCDVCRVWGPAHGPLQAQPSQLPHEWLLGHLPRPGPPPVTVAAAPCGGHHDLDRVMGVNGGLTCTSAVPGHTWAVQEARPSVKFLRAVAMEAPALSLRTPFGLTSVGCLLSFSSQQASV